MSHHQALAIIGDITEHFLGIFINYRGAHRHFENQIITTPTGTVATAASLATLGAIISLKAIIHQGIEVDIAFQINRAAVTTIATVGPTFGHEFLTAKTQATVTTATGMYVNRCFIDKFHDGSIPRSEGLELNRVPLAARTHTIHSIFKYSNTKKPRLGGAFQ